jgi:lysophospholipase
MAVQAAQASGTASEWRESFFNVSDGLRLFHAAALPASPRAVVIVVHGYGDHALRYRHVMERLAAEGFAAHALDYRGHGRAGGRRGFTASFADYTRDLSAFIDRVRAESGPLPLFLLGHSHGALVVGTLLLSDNPPRNIAGVILTSPYFQLRIAPTAFQLFQARVVGKIVPFLRIKSPLTSAMLTTDTAMQKAADADPLMHRVVTPRWFTESNAAQVVLLSKAKAFTIPLLVLHGADDGIAHPDGSRAFFDAASSGDKRYIAYSGMLHEIYNEVEREKPIAETVAWLSAHLDGKASKA